VSEQGKTRAGARDSKLGAETRKNQVQQTLPRRAHFADECVHHFSFDNADHLANDQYSVATPSASEAVEEAQPEPVDEAAALEARRKRREAIRAKYRSQASPLHLQALHVDTDSSTPGSTPVTETASAQDTSGKYCNLEQKSFDTN
jgi:serine/threonine-protein kinase PRP4